MLTELLARLKFSPSERAVLHQLLSGGETTAGLLAKRLGIKRPTAYAALHALVNRGIAVEKKRGAKTIYAPIELQKISSLLEAEARGEWESKQTAARTLGGLLAEFSKKQNFASIDQFEIALLSSARAVRDEMERMLLSGDFVSVWNPTHMRSESRKTTERFLTDTAKSKPSIHEIIPLSSESKWYAGKIRNPNHHIKFAPSDFAIQVDVVASRDMVTIMSPRDEGEGAIVIKHRRLGETMHAAFFTLWRTLK